MVTRRPPPEWLQRVFDEADAACADDYAFQKRIKALQAQRKDVPQRLVHKTFETPRRATQAVQPQLDSDGVAPLPAHVQKRWAEWADQRADNRIKAALADFKKLLGEKLSAELDKILKDVATAMGTDYRDLNEKIAAQRAELETLQRLVGELHVDMEVERAAKVIDLPRWPRGKSDAA